jgi:2-polyprenyl-3-methyl-5-hydroxy-6-metoxy-1,4-benzoquinol methylase
VEEGIACVYVVEHIPLSSPIVMNLDEEVRPYTTSAEREKTENLATLYSIIVSLEYLERAYVRDSVTGKEYVLSCCDLTDKTGMHQHVSSYWLSTRV